MKIGIVNPTPDNLKRIFFLSENNFLRSEIELCGIYHESQSDLISLTREFIVKEACEDFELMIAKGEFDLNSLMQKNECVSSFKHIFDNTDGLFFMGGDDFSPSLYGEDTFFTTELIDYERNWEISFLYHLIGNSEQNNSASFLKQRPCYFILGICFGMQSMNLVNGGDVWQDIPYQLYGLSSYEAVLKQDGQLQHKNYWQKVHAEKIELSRLHFHNIAIKKASFLDFSDSLCEALVTSTHHQSVRNVGVDFDVIATSLDGKVVEAIQHKYYKNVIGLQFHPEFSELFTENASFKISPEQTVSLDENQHSFLNCLWKRISNSIISSKCS